MNDIENKIRSKIERFGNRSMMFTRAEVTELLTTIESQKEEIETLKRRMDRLVDTSVDISEHESLKAITELAVRGLERISVTFERGEMVRLAYEHLHKIKEMQND